jgi:hypothetical protein
MKQTTVHYSPDVFHTGLICSESFPIPSKLSVAGSGWRIRFKLLPKFDGVPQHSSAVRTSQGGTRIIPGKELVIEARSAVAAARATQLVRQAKLALDAETLFLTTDPIIFPNPHDRYGAPDLATFLRRSYVATSGFVRAGELAVRVSRDRAAMYALAKLSLSMELYSTPIVDLDPHHTPYPLPRSSFPSDHVRFAYCIVLAYATIEELGFEIRASQSSPSRLTSGSWNPKVRTDLEERLTKGKIDLREPISWNRRRTNSRLDRLRKPAIAARANWARGTIRDADVEIIEAINAVSFLRSKVASHRLRNADALTVYDVANAQFVARRLLLETMGFWR